MLRRKFFAVVALLAGAALFAAPNSARADLIIRLTSLNNSGGTQLDQQSSTLVLSDPMPSMSSQVFSSPLLGGFSIVITSNISNTGNGTTAHSHNINFTYTGPTGIGSSNQLVVEFLGTNYDTPVSPPLAFITSNASPSTSGLVANYVNMVSGASVTNAGLPGTAGDTTGLLGLTSGTGTMGSASSILSPNPVTGATFSQTGSRFSFYQAFTFNDFTTTGSGSLSAGSTVTNVPAPPSLVMALSAMPILGMGRRLFRRKAVVTA